MNKVRGVIFDLDGVLCRTDAFHTKAWKRLGENLGINVPDDIGDKIRGISRMDSLDIVLGDKAGAFSNEEKLALAEQKNNYYKEYLSTMTEADCLPGAKELIAALKTEGILVAIGSSSKNTVAILGKIGLLDSFDAIADGTQITHSKPDPEVFLLAAGQLGLKSEACIVVEDAYMGIEAAKRGHFIPVAIGRDAASHKGAQYRIEALSQILAIVDGENK